MSFLKEAFTNTYKSNKWGSSESFSGPGSEVTFSKSFSENLIRIIEKYEIKSIFDTSCGDWNWMKEIKDKLPNYVGNDIVEELIEENRKKYGAENIKFVCGDLVESLQSNGKVDLVVCRHTLEHLSNDYVIHFLSEVKNYTNYLLVTSQNYTNSFDGFHPNGVSARSVNLDLSVFVEIVGTPIEKIWDHISTQSDTGTFGYLYKFKN